MAERHSLFIFIVSCLIWWLVVAYLVTFKTPSFLFSSNFLVLFD